MRRWLNILWLSCATCAFAHVPQATYTRGLDLSGTFQGAGGIGGLLARTDHTITNANFATVYYHADGAGNITALVNTNGLIVARYLYDPFGKLVAKSGALADANRYRFSSKEVQPLSGLCYYGFRFYDPSLQRWLNQDPLGEAGGINLHRFVFNSPLSWIDPDGGQATSVARSPVRPPVEQFEGEITREIRQGLRRSRAEQLEFEWERDWQTRRNTREMNERFYPNLPNLTGQPEMRALIPRPAQPSRSEQRPASQNQSQCVNQNAPPNATYLYQKVGAQGEHLKFGVTDSPSTRYSEAQLKGGRLRIVAQGERPEMLRLEREIHETLPIGSEEGQQFYIRMQV